MQYEFGGGAVRLGTSLDVPRPVDERLEGLLKSRRNIVSVVAPRQSGKSSLLQSVGARLEAYGHRVAMLDLREVFGPPNEENRTAERWFPILYRAIARPLHIPPRDVNDWLAGSGDLSSVHRTVRFVEEFLHERVREPLTIVLDEIDIVRLYWYHTDDLFEALRVLGSRRDALDLSVVVAGIHHPSALLKVMPASTFNLSVNVTLSDFGDDDDTVRHWTRGLLIDEPEATEVGRAVLRQTGGQAYLTSVLFNDALENDADSADAVANLAAQLVADVRSGDRPNAHFSAPRDLILENERDAYRALDAYEKMLDGSLDALDVDDGARSLLRTTGLIVERDGRLTVKSPIYRDQFDRAWVKRLKEEVGRRGGERLRRGFSLHRDKEVKDTICVLNTGGIIAAERRPDGIIAEPLDLAAFFEDFPEMHDIAHVDPVPLMGKDSTNVSPADWHTIANAIYERRNKGYKGFVVAHGTDTLAYSASAVAFALGPGLNFPVVFTAAQVPRHVPHGDARPNLLRACTVATKDIPEVVVCADDLVFRAVRAEKKDDYRFECFHSPTLPPLAVIADQVEIQQSLVRRTDESRGLECRAAFSEGVFKFAVFPGLNPELLLPVLEAPSLRGVIIETPGIGNVPTDGRLSLLPFIEKAVRERRLPVLLVSQYPIQTAMSAIYAPATEPIKRGAIPAANMSAPAAVAKFMWVLPQVEDHIKAGRISEDDKMIEIKNWMNRNFVGEIDVRRPSKI